MKCDQCLKKYHQGHSYSIIIYCCCYLNCVIVHFFLIDPLFPGTQKFEFLVNLHNQSIWNIFMKLFFYSTVLFSVASAQTFTDLILWELSVIDLY